MSIDEQNDEQVVRDEPPIGQGAPLRDRLREVVEALDRRVPRPEREGEARIAEDAAALKQKALEQIASLEVGPRVDSE